MVVLVVIFCTFLWFVMQGGNKAFGKGIGTLMGILVIGIPIMAICCLIATVLLPLLFSTLPVLGFFALVGYVFSRVLGRQKVC